MKPGDTALNKMINCFCTLTRNHQALQVWRDFLVIGACSTSPLKQSEYRPEFINITGRYSSNELMLMMEMLEITATALDSNPENDFLKESYTFLGLEIPQSKRKSSSRIRTSVNTTRLKEKLATRPWLTVKDDACGSGSAIIQLLNKCRQENINYQSTVLFVAKDHNREFALACYLQLSLLGCAGYVIAPNALGFSHSVGGALYDAHQGYEIWVLPMTYTGDWQWRLITELERTECIVKS